MSGKDALTPRIFLIRHGETEWSVTGQFTGKTEVSLTKHGREQVTATGKMVYGKGKLIDPAKVAKVFVSPRSRAVQTWELLAGNGKGEGEGEECELRRELEEWDYGEYEGITPTETKKRRKAQGLDQDRPWDIWRDGCAGGESPAQFQARLDVLIAEIKALQAPLMKASGDEPKDVVLISHGHTTRAFAKRWMGFDISSQMSLMMEPSAVGVLSYQHHSVDEPALCVGAAFPVGS